MFMFCVNEVYIKIEKKQNICLFMIIRNVCEACMPPQHQPQVSFSTDWLITESTGLQAKVFSGQG